MSEHGALADRLQLVRTDGQGLGLRAARSVQRHDELLVVPSHLFLMLPKYLSEVVRAQLPPGYVEEFEGLERWCADLLAADECGTENRHDPEFHRRRLSSACMC